MTRDMVICRFSAQSANPVLANRALNIGNHIASVWRDVSFAGTSPCTCNGRMSEEGLGGLHKLFQSRFKAFEQGAEFLAVEQGLRLIQPYPSTITHPFFIPRFMDCRDLHGEHGDTAITVPLLIDIRPDGIARYTSTDARLFKGLLFCRSPGSHSRFDNTLGQDPSLFPGAGDEEDFNSSCMSTERNNARLLEEPLWNP